jgi:uncharacterized coiled-coil DUF342 family protein
MQKQKQAMPFEIPTNGERSLATDADDGVPVPRSAGQLALRLSDARAFDIAARRAGRPPPQTQAHISHLCQQIEALREQLSAHSADRMALLLREMIAEREGELERWIAREENWDRRLTSIEDAIVERDDYRQREAELVRERDEARHLADTARAKLEAAQRAAEQAHREAAQVHRAVELANAEQLRLRAERDLDRRVWNTERRKLAEKAEQGGWLKRLVRG